MTFVYIAEHRDQDYEDYGVYVVSRTLSGAMKSFGDDRQDPETREWDRRILTSIEADSDGNLQWFVHFESEADEIDWDLVLADGVGDYIIRRELRP